MASATSLHLEPGPLVLLASTVSYSCVPVQELIPAVKTVSAASWQAMVMFYTTVAAKWDAYMSGQTGFQEPITAGSASLSIGGIFLTLGMTLEQMVGLLCLLCTYSDFPS